MDTRIMSTILEGYAIQKVKAVNMPIVTQYLESHDTSDRSFLMDLAMFSSDSLFMKRKYQGPLEDFNQLILDNKELIISKLKDIDDYRSLRNLLARDFELCSSIELFLSYKQIYQVDATFMKDLIQTQYGNPTVPLSIFKHLPFESFYLDLENTGICKHINGTFVSVKVEDRQLKIVCQVIGKPFDEDDSYASKGYFGTHTCRVLLDCNDTDDPNADEDDVQIDCDVSQFDEDELHLDGILSEIYNNWPGSGIWDICFMWYVIVPFLMYLNSDKSDIQDRPAKKSAQKRISSGTASTVDKLKISEVGYVYGCKVRKYSQTTRKDRSSSSENLHQSKRSHMRRAHWHTYRCGKGRQDTRLIWMPPMYIQGNSDSAITIHKVE